MVANPAIQQPSLYPVCGLNHDISQCKKEQARLNAEITKRGGQFTGADESSVGILHDRNKNVKKGLMNIMVLVRDVSCVSLLEVIDRLITFPKNVGPRIRLINSCKIQRLIRRRKLKKSDITKEKKGLSAQVINCIHGEDQEVIVKDEVCKDEVCKVR